MSKWIPTNSNILSPKPPKNSFIVGEGNLLYAVLPIGGRLCIVYQGIQLKICNNETSARNFIKKHQKRRKK